jgi:hypothetical protein
MKIRFFKPYIALSEWFIISITISGLTIVELNIGEYHALNKSDKGVIITILGFTIQITGD